jgi:hypothetical protein
MIAKNAGIRRASGKFVLATNIDILFSEALIQFIAKKKLDPGCMYRVDRYDVSSDLSQDWPIERQLAYCRDHVLRINRREGTFGIHSSIRTLGAAWLVTYFMECAPSCLLKSWVWLRSWLPLKKGLKYYLDPSCMASFTVNRLRRIYCTARHLLEGILRLAMECWSSVKRYLTTQLFYIGQRRKKRLHTNACGDFTLLSREQWVRLRGYPEWEMFSIHLDSVFCQQAYYAGLGETVLSGDRKIFHMEHGSGWSPGQTVALMRKMETRGVPCLSADQYEAWISRMRASDGPVIFNGESWGLSGHRLKESRPYRSVDEVQHV